MRSVTEIHSMLAESDLTEWPRRIATIEADMTPHALYLAGSARLHLAEHGGLSPDERLGMVRAADNRFRRTYEKCGKQVQGEWSARAVFQRACTEWRESAAQPTYEPQIGPEPEVVARTVGRLARAGSMIVDGYRRGRDAPPERKIIYRNMRRALTELSVTGLAAWSRHDQRDEQPIGTVLPTTFLERSSGDKSRQIMPWDVSVVTPGNHFRIQVKNSTWEHDFVNYPRFDGTVTHVFLRPDLAIEFDCETQEPSINPSSIVFELYAIRDDRKRAAAEVKLRERSDRLWDTLRQSQNLEPIVEE